MCIYSFLSTIDLCLSVNTQPREDKDTVSFLTGQIASEIAMPMNMHNQHFQFCTASVIASTMEVQFCVRFSYMYRGI